MKEDLQELQSVLVQTIIDFYQTHKLPENAYSLDFNFDSIQDSVSRGSWHPGSDCWCTVEDKNYEPILQIM